MSTLKGRCTGFLLPLILVLSVPVPVHGDNERTYQTAANLTLVLEQRAAIYPDALWETCNRVFGRAGMVENTLAALEAAIEAAGPEKRSVLLVQLTAPLTRLELDYQPCIDLPRADGGVFTRNYFARLVNTAGDDERIR